MSRTDATPAATRCPARRVRVHLLQMPGAVNRAVAFLVAISPGGVSTAATLTISLPRDDDGE